MGQLPEYRILSIVTGFNTNDLYLIFVTGAERSSKVRFNIFEKVGLSYLVFYLNRFRSLLARSKSKSEEGTECAFHMPHKIQSLWQSQIVAEQPTYILKFVCILTLIV